MTPGSILGCSENIINTMFFGMFHFFTQLMNWMIFNGLCDVFLVAFGVPWGYVFRFLRVCTLEGPRLRAHGQVVVKGSFVGPEPPHSQQDHHPPVSLILYIDSRSPDYRIQDILHDTIMQDAGLKGQRMKSVNIPRSLVAPLRGAGGYIIRQTQP